MAPRSTGLLSASTRFGIFLALSLAAGGCGVFGDDNRGVIAERKVSPDRSLEAYVRADDRMNFSSLVRLGTMREHVWVHWGSPGSPLKSRKLLVAKAPADEESPFPIADDVRLVFAPDSRRLAVVTPNALQVVDLITGRRWELTGPGERVSSLAWVSPSEVVYASHTYLVAPPLQDDGRQTLSDRTFWRQQYDQPPLARQILLHEMRVAAGANRRFAWPLESFSPTGDRVIFRSPIEGGQFIMMDLNGQAGRRFGATSTNCQVWWKDDGSRALVSQAIPDKYILVDSFTGRATDVSAKVVSVLDRERRWRRNPSFDQYGEMQNDAAKAVLWQGISDDEPRPFQGSSGLIRPLSMR